MNNSLLPNMVIFVATIAVAVPIYALVLTALAWRLTARVPSAWDLPTLPLRAAAWMTAFALYLWRFAPLLIRPGA